MKYWLREFTIDLTEDTPHGIFDDFKYDESVDEILNLPFDEFQILVRVDSEGWCDLGKAAEDAVVEMIDERDIYLMGDDRKQLVENIKYAVNRFLNEN